MTIKISEVRAAHKVFDEYGYTVDGLSDVLYRDSAESIIATHNAMPVFLEVVEAALAHDVAGKDAAKIRFAWVKADDARDPGAYAMLDQVGDADREVNRLLLAYRAALAKVTR